MYHLSFIFFLSIFFTPFIFCMEKKLVSMENYNVLKNYIKQTPYSAHDAYQLIKAIISITDPKHAEKTKQVIENLYVNVGKQKINITKSDKKAIKKNALEKGIELINDTRKKEIELSFTTTDLQLAILNNHDKIFKLLFTFCDEETRKKLGWRLLHCSIIHANIQILDFMLKNNISCKTKSPTTGDSLWHLATTLPKECGLNILRYLTNYYEKCYKTSFNWTLVNNEGYTPLLITCSYHCRNIGTSTLSYILQKYDKNINDADSFGNTPLILASLWDCSDTIEELIRNGGNPNLQNNNGDTALHHACDYLYVNTIKILLKSNIDVTIKNNSQKSALALLLSPQKRRTADDWRKTLTILGLLLEAGADASSIDLYGETPLHYLISISIENNWESLYIFKAINLLLAHNANLKIRNKDMVTPLFYCNFMIYTKENKDHWKFIKYLIKLHKIKFSFTEQSLEKLLNY